MADHSNHNHNFDHKCPYGHGVEKFESHEEAIAAYEAKVKKEHAIKG